jgi:RNA polymerase-binding protein DksA
MKNSEFAGIKSQLLELRTRLLLEVNSAERALREDVVKVGEISSVPTHPADQDVEGSDTEVAIAQNEELLLEQVEAALQRIRTGTYGICQQCGRTIDAQRLQAVPYTADCIDCARGRADQTEKPVRGEGSRSSVPTSPPAERQEADAQRGHRR